MKIVKCNYCKKEFKCEPWRIKKNKTLFCCKKCQYEYRKTNKYIKFDTYYKLILQNKENIEILIDLDDFEKVSQYQWNLWGGYVATTKKVGNKRKSIKLHRLIMNCPNNKVIDHINHNPLDNRKSNLRIVMQKQNVQNSTLRKDNKTGCTGVYKSTGCNSYFVNIKVNKKIIHLGSFKNLKDAINARKNAEKKYWKYKDIVNKAKGEGKCQ